MTSKSDSIGVTCTRLWHFADTFSQWNSCWKKLTLGHMTENKCGYQMHIFVTSFSAQHAPAWRCFCMVQPLRQPFRPKCTNRILQMHHQNPVVPPESGAHPQNPVCTYSVCQSGPWGRAVDGWPWRAAGVNFWNNRQGFLTAIVSEVYQGRGGGPWTDGRDGLLPRKQMEDILSVRNINHTSLYM